VPVAEQARHLRELRDGYGSIEPEAVLDAMVRSQTWIVELETASLGSPGLPAVRLQHARAAVAWASAGRDLLRQHRAIILAALG